MFHQYHCRRRSHRECCRYDPNESAYQGSLYVPFTYLLTCAHNFIAVPRMTPILRNRHEKVQEACINLIGRIGEYRAVCSAQHLTRSLQQPIVVLNTFRQENGCESVSSSWIY
jgi:hypothetical protein